MESSHGSIGLAAVLLLLPAAAGCMSAAECAGQQAYQGQDGVCNTEDAFAYGGQVGGKTDTETYTWTNTEGAASVSWGGQGSGRVQVTIQDAAGQQVHQTTFSGGQAGGSQTTQAGEPGDWTITISFMGFSGQMGLSVQAQQP